MLGKGARGDPRPGSSSFLFEYGSMRMQAGKQEPEGSMGMD